MSIGSIGGERAARPVAPAADKSPAVTSPSRSSTVEAPSFAQILNGAGREITRGEATMKAATQAQNLNATELLALQTGVYRYSESIGLASKLVDAATNAVKTVLNEKSG